VLRAFDIQTGKVVWELPQTGSAESFGGVLSTAGGVVFYGADDGAFAAADARTGKPLWSFPTGEPPHASADDVPVRQQAIRCRRNGSEHHRLRPARLEERGVVLNNHGEILLRLAPLPSLRLGAGKEQRPSRATLKVPLGLQLYSVREILPKDYAGTLKQIGALGYREVEAAGYLNHSARR